MTALLGAGCAARVGYSASVSSGGYGYGPDLVYAGPGVQVIADFDEAIFFADSFYWRFDAGRWYRSPHYTGGWVYATPPAAVLRIDRPHAYVHYRPHGWTGRRGGVAPQPNQPRVEGRRGAPPPRQPTYQQPPPRMQPQQQPQPRFQQQPPQPRMQRPPQYQHPPRMQPPFREGPPAPRGPDRRDNRGSGDRGRR